MSERHEGTAAAELKESAGAAEHKGEGTAAGLIGTAAAELNMSADAVSEGSAAAVFAAGGLEG